MYNKIFTKILDSSIWLEPETTRIVWVTCIAAMDEDGFVQFASVANLAHRANVSLDAAQRAVEILEGPDPNSSDPDNEGRRIERIPGGWIVLNAQKYRDLVTREQVKAQGRERARTYRKRRSLKRNDATRKRNAGVRNNNAPVRADNASVTPSDTDTDTESRAEVEAAAEAARPLPQQPTARNGAASKTALPPSSLPPENGHQPLPARPRAYGRITLHRWQIDELIQALGPLAEDFGLDVWIHGLSALADEQKLLLDKKSLWPWVQAQLKEECERRGFRVAGAEPDPQSEHDAIVKRRTEMLRREFFPEKESA